MSSKSRPPLKASFSRGNSLGYLVNDLARLFGRALYERLAKHDVALGQFPILLVLWEEEQLTQSEIARRLDIEQPTVANTLRRMERDGLVKTSPDPRHGRQILIGLTEKGRLLQAPLCMEAQAVNRAAASDLTEQELATFFSLLARLRRGLANVAAQNLSESGPKA